MAENYSDVRFELALAMLPACTLDSAGRGAQKHRYQELGGAIRHVQRQAQPAAVLIDFGEALDATKLQALIAVERDCCPFLGFDFDMAAGRLTVTTNDAAWLPALDAVEAAFMARAR